MVSYRSAHKLSSYIVRAKQYPIERKVGSCKCKGKRCEVCKNVLETDAFTSSNDPTTYKINHKFDCNEKCLVYSRTLYKKGQLLLMLLLKSFMTSIYFIISIETRLVTHFSGYKTITLHEKAMLYVLDHDFCFFVY